MKEKQVLKNAKWIIVCKVFQSVIQLVIGMLTARYLGPSNYGLINYAASIVAFAMPLMKLGMDAILVYELVESPDKEGEIMGTSLLLNMVSGVFCIFGVIAFSTAMNFGDFETVLICGLYSLSVFFAAVEMIQYWFQYKLLSKYSSLVMLAAYGVVSAYKVYLLVTAKNVYWFSVSHSIEFGLIGIALWILYFRKGGQRFTFSKARAKKMLSKGKHYILSALMVMVIQNTDHIMLTAVVGKAENGLYSAAITSIAVFQFVYVAITDSFRPMILAEKKANGRAYQNSISRVYGVIVYMAIAQGIVFFLMAELIIQILYGSDFAGAVSILRVLTVYFVFSAMGLVRNMWILAEEKQKHLWVINFSGALLNVALNAVMIPLWGAFGAAFASMLTQCFANFVLGFLIKPLRPNNRLMLHGLNPKYLFGELKIIAKELKK